jgi:Asp-tRNA(Asn)/Glu-tRNA(Gln) amidotransferase A subunit family amidase
MRKPSHKQSPYIPRLATGLREGRLSVGDLANRCIQSWQQLSEELPAFVELKIETLRSEAQVLDQELRSIGPRSALHGVPIAIKDNIAVADTTMSAGCAAYSKHSDRDAEVIRRLRSAGALIIPRARMHELAFGATGANWHDGGVPHPFVEGRVTGGSSSGSTVAVAVGICPVALGTDTGGSVRLPAALCGIVGYKPTKDLIPTSGVLIVSTTMDHVGILACSVQDIAVVMKSIANPGQPASNPSGSLAVLEGSVRGVDANVSAAFAIAVRKLRSAGLDIKQVRGPDWNRIFNVCGDIISFEAYENFSFLLDKSAGELGPDVRTRLQQSGMVTDEAYRRALQERDRISFEMSEIFAAYGAVVGPTVPMIAPKAELSFDLGVAARLARNTRLYNLVGAPAITLPIGRRRLGIGLQLASAPANDERLLNFAAEISQVITL